VIKGDDSDNGGDISTDTNPEDGIMKKLDRLQKPAKEGNLVFSDGISIAMLPSPRLKDREHILEVSEMATHHTSST
jgi:hypothetical protein